MLEKDLRDIKTVIRSLPDEQKWMWAREFGTGDRKEINSILDQINSDAIEQGACDVLKKVLGIEVMTAKEKVDYLAQEERDLRLRDVEANELLAAEAERRRQGEQAEEQKGSPVTKLQVFVSWSSSWSHKVARVLREWLPKVIPELEPWVSSVDIRKGKPWFGSISSQLAKSRAGIICVTRKNLGAPWIYYESGAIAQALSDDDCVVCPYLVGVPKDALSATPLGQFQLTSADKADTLLMLQSLNLAIPRPHPSEMIESVFNVRWPSLQGRLARILTAIAAEEAEPKPTPPPPFAQEKPLSDLAQEILLAAAAGERQTVTMNANNVTGFCLGAGGQTIMETHDGRQEAQGRAAVDELLRRELIEDRWHRGQVFQVTEPGYRMADTLDKD